jgi:hypothetical protein
MLVIGIILLAFPIGIVLTGIFGRKYEDLTDEEKEKYHRIEKEKERERPANIRKVKKFRYTTWPLSLWNDN